MPITKEITLFTFEELSEEAKEKAKDWWLSCRDSSDFEFVVDDFERVANILGVELRQRTFRTMGGGTGSEPSVRWGLHSQGSGASFEGTYSYAKGSAKAILEHAPQDGELHAIARELQEVQARHRYAITATMRDGNLSNFYPHSGTMAVEVDFGRDLPNSPESDADEDQVIGLMRRLADRLYQWIMDEDEYQTSDEAIAGAMEANEYTFRADGKRAE